MKVPTTVHTYIVLSMYVRDVSAVSPKLRLIRCGSYVNRYNPYQSRLPHGPLP